MRKIIMMIALIICFIFNSFSQENTIKNSVSFKDGTIMIVDTAVIGTNDEIYIKKGDLNFFVDKSIVYKVNDIKINTQFKIINSTDTIQCNYINKSYQDDLSFLTNSNKLLKYEILKTNLKLDNFYREQKVSQFFAGVSILISVCGIIINKKEAKIAVYSIAAVTTIVSYVFYLDSFKYLTLE